jgi:Fis family transcriptional regulator
MSAVRHPPGACVAVNAVSLSRADTSADVVIEPLLHDRVSRSVRRYLADLDNTECHEGLYELVMREVERPLLNEVMKWHDGNQSRAAATLGINRATLRKKLIQHGLA